MSEIKDLYADLLTGISSRNGVVCLAFGKHVDKNSEIVDGIDMKDANIRPSFTVTVPLPAFMQMAQVIPRALQDDNMKELIKGYIQAGLLVSGRKDDVETANDLPEKGVAKASGGKSK